MVAVGVGASLGFQFQSQLSLKYEDKIIEGKQLHWMSDRRDILPLAAHRSASLVAARTLYGCVGVGNAVWVAMATSVVLVCQFQ